MPQTLLNPVGGPPRALPASQAPPRPPARDARPPLGDRDRYVCLPLVPILDAHDNPDPAKGQVTVEDLRRIASNSNARASRGTYALLLIGHTTDEGPETGQPPLVGFATAFVIGDFAGRPCLLADLYVERGKYDEAMTYPHRSVERFRGDDPADHYIDAISLLRRAPDRELGLLTYGRPGQVVRHHRALGPLPPAPSAGPQLSPAEARWLVAATRGLDMQAAIRHAAEYLHRTRAR